MSGCFIKCAARFTRLSSRYCFSKPSFTTLSRHSLKRAYCSAIDYAQMIKDPSVQNYLDVCHRDLNKMDDKIRSDFQKNELISQLYSKRINLQENLKILKEFEQEQHGDKDIIASAVEERLCYESQLLEVEYKIIESLLSEDMDTSSKGLLFEISPGVGGQEAMLFAKTLFDMYCGYIEYKGWNFYIAEEELSHLGGIRHACIIVEGSDVFPYLKFESGVHRVQRVPSTEKSGRVHTSTVTVAVIPQPEDVNITINEKDLIIETKRASGAGGQHVNTTDSAVRITHVPSGIVVECQTERSQIRNRGIAMARLEAKLYQRELEEKNSAVRCVRKSQIGIGARSDRIRTYNFHQDRITDHRKSGSFHNLSEFFKGGHLLDELIKDLIDISSKEKFITFIDHIRNNY